MDPAHPHSRPIPSAPSDAAADTKLTQLLDRIEIRELVENWAVWRDAGDWERLATVWDRDAYMSTTWFQGQAIDFIAASRAGFERGIRVLHFLGGSSVQVDADRGIAQTKMTITQRGQIHGVACDVVCTGRFFDFVIRRDAWKIVRRQPIYEIDQLYPLDPRDSIPLDIERLDRLTPGYRHLAYLQEEAGQSVKPDLPGLTGPATQQLYEQGKAWLGGSRDCGVPPH